MSVERYSRIQKQQIEKLIADNSTVTKKKTSPPWKTIQTIGSCELVRNGARPPKQQSVSVRTKMKGKINKRLRVHQAIFIVKEGKIPIWRRIQNISAANRKTISHICGRPLCKNPAHLKCESLKDNLQRCECHEFMKNSKDKLTNHCLHKNHDPPCLYNHI